MLHIGRYIKELLDVFVRWWWAVTTGVASILSWLSVPESGITLSRTGLSIFVFLTLGLVFLTMSATVQGYRWYIGQAQPRVLRFLHKPDGGDACAFVIDFGSADVKPGYLLSLSRDLNGEEVCFAVLRIDKVRSQDGHTQCVPLWIAAAHLAQLQKPQSSFDVSKIHVSHTISERVIDRLKE